MKIAAHLFRKYRKSINPPYNRKDMISILGTLVILTAIPLTVWLAQQAKEPAARAKLPAVQVSNEDQVKTLTKQLLLQRKNLQKAPPGLKVQEIANLKEISKARKQVMLSLIEENPREFLKLSFSPEVKKTFPSETQVSLEEKVSLEGEMETFHMDNFDKQKGKIDYFLKVGDQMFSLYPTRPLPTPFADEKVKVSGLVLDDKIVLDSDDKESFQLARGSSSVLGVATGEQRLAVILVNFQDDTSQPVTKSQVQNVLNTEVDPFYKEASYNKFSVPGDVFGWYTLPINFTCDFGIIRDEALKASDPDINFQNYKHLMYAFHGISKCGYGGIAGGTDTFPGPNISYTSPDGTITVTHAWILADLNNIARITAHELGHNLGDILEGNALDCGNEVIGVPSYDGGSCTHIDYGDLFDVMGSATLGHFNAYHKEVLGWFDPSNIITATTNGTYTIEPLETATSGPKIIKIPRDKNSLGQTISWLYLEFRQLIGFDAKELWMTYSSNPTNGALVHYPYPIRPWADEPDNIAAYYSYLLDATPESQSNEVYDRSDSALEVGKTFTDSAYGITIRTTAKTASSLSVEVNLGQPTCTRANPTVVITPASQWAVPSEAVTYEVSITNNDTNPCGAAIFTLAPTVPAGWSAALASNEPTINPGATFSASLSVTSSASASDGIYDVTITAQNKGATSYSSSAEVSYVVDNTLGKTGDLNGDNKVDILDLSKLITFWGATSGMADINKDSIVNIFDLSILLTNWGELAGD